MNSIDKKYFDLIRKILKKGNEKTDRTGTGTISIFDHTISFNMKEGFPLLTSKKMAWKSMVIELLWFLKGDTNIKYLVDNGCYIWVGDAYKNYEKAFKYRINDKLGCVNSNDVKSFEFVSGNEYPNVTLFSRQEFIEKIKTDNKFAEKWGELGPVYGKQWRNWETNISMTGGENKKIDQISNLIYDLKNNPDSRRLIVNAWNVGEMDQMVLPPCHYGFQCYTRELEDWERDSLYFSKEKRSDYEYGRVVDYDSENIPKRALSLKWTQRSVDTFLGLPFNIASYGLLLSLLAKEVNMLPDELIFSGGDVHIYNNHIEQCKTQLKQKTYKLPTIEISDKNLFEIEYNDIKLVDYVSSAPIKGELSN